MLYARSLLFFGVLIGCGTVDDGTQGDDDPMPTATTVDAASVVRVRQGGSAVIDIAVTRGPFEGALNAAVVGLPTGVTALPIQIGAGSAAGSIVVRAEATAAQMGPLDVKLQVMAAQMIEVPLRLYVAGPSASADTSFSGDGTITLASEVASATDVARDVIIDAQGRIVIVGSAQVAPTSQAFMYRLTSAGIRDATFGTAGRIKPAFETIDGVVDGGGSYLGVTAGGGIQVQRFDGVGALVGAAVPSSVPRSAVGTPVHILRVADGAIIPGASAFEKFGFDGALDTRFGTNGKVTVGPTIGGAVDSRGRIVAGGAFQLARVLAGGMVDGSFSVTFPPPTGFDEVFTRHIGLDRQDGGYACGQMFPTGKGYPDAVPVLLRFRADGTIDTGFGTNGVRTLLGPTGVGSCEEIAVLPDGRLLLSAVRGYTGGTLEVWMLQADGSFDTSFGNGGVLLAPNNSIGAMAVDEGGRVILAGTGSNTNGSLVYVSRYWL